MFFYLLRPSMRANPGVTMLDDLLVRADFGGPPL